MSTLLRLALVLFIIQLVGPAQLWAQSRTCTMDEVMAEKLLDEDYRQRFEKKRIQARIIGQSGERALCANPVVLPVAVHFQNVSNPDQPCLVALAQNQIQIINDDLQGLNMDISNWINTDAAEFPGLDYGETCVEFCLATFNHPTGYGLIEGEPAVTINETSGDSDNNWTGYINIWVRNIGALGYSPLGGDGDGDGVTIDNNAFGSGAGCSGVSPSSPYDLGRTLTHELGHYLNLDHIWGGGCSNDDGIADTPNSSSSYGGCPSGYPSTCGSKDMYMNYMDYVNDLCMYTFSAGQSAVMESYVSSSLQNVVNNAANVCAAPTCTDGIQNGNETGVDCGGPDCAACPPPTCTDGLQNGNETGVDCGGPDCAPCPPCISLALTLNFDNYPEETSWSIEDANGNVVASGGTYGSESDGSTLTLNECLPAGTYDFIMSDAYGDGMCCGYGNGSYDLSSCGVSLAAGASYGSSETTSFTLVNEFVFLGTVNDDWDNAANWESNTVPSSDYDCIIRITANCKKTGALNVKGEVIVEPGMRLTSE